MASIAGGAGGPAGGAGSTDESGAGSPISTGGGGATASSLDPKELFKLGLRINGTHTKMSADKFGDYKRIPGDGWCLYSSFLVAFEKSKDNKKSKEFD